MESTFLLETPVKNRFFASAETTFCQKENKAQLNNGFYYLGKKKDNIAHLVKLFPKAFISGVFKDAASELLKCISKKNGMIPDVIFFDPDFDLISFTGFRKFLEKEPALSSIPLILDGSNLTEVELNYFRGENFFDEIIFLKDFDERNLLSKIKFLRKIKSRKNELYLHPVTDGLTVFENILKRTFDITVSILVLILLSPLFLLIALIIKIESRGDAFYVSKRAGRGYKIFDFYKFRTMCTGAEEKIAEYAHLNLYKTNITLDSPVFIKIGDDPRITRVGSFLRNTSLDELPQFINVLLGDMSLVGNRPLPLYEAAELTTDELAKRFMAPAGITGLWQIKKRGKQNMSAEERISLDMDYADHGNFLYDLWIIVQTPFAIFQKTDV